MRSGLAPIRMTFQACVSLACGSARGFDSRGTNGIFTAIGVWYAQGWSKYKKQRMFNETDKEKMSFESSSSFLRSFRLSEACISSDTVLQFKLLDQALRDKGYNTRWDSNTPPGQPAVGN